jgi:hypothetical protein
MVAHSTPKTGVEWGTHNLGCRCREDGSFLSRLASASGLLGMTKGGVALPCSVVADGCVDRRMLPVAVGLATCFRSLPVLSNLFNNYLAKPVSFSNSLDRYGLP